MRLRKKEKCAICKAMTDFPEAHFLDFHYGRGKNAGSTDTVRGHSKSSEGCR